MKSEPSVFSFQNLKEEKNQTTCWNGVRNYQARNFMVNDMKIGDEVLFYHSSCEEPSIQGICTVSAQAYPDDSAQDSQSKYYDPKSTPEKPIWFMVDLKWKKDFKKPVSLNEIRKVKKLSNMLLLKKGQRLSIQPVSVSEFKLLCEMGSKQN